MNSERFKVKDGNNSGMVSTLRQLLLIYLITLMVGPGISTAADNSVQLGRGILELESGETVLTVGGRINLTGYWDSPAGNFSAAGVPASGSGEDGELDMNLRNSRLWFKTRTPTEYGLMHTYIETDFGGTAGNEISSNSHNLRLRHAFFQIGGLTVGQTWSTFQTYVAPDILTDAAYIQWTRQPMVRWSGNHDYSYDLALEQPETLLRDSDGGEVLPSDDRVPDMVARLRLDRDWGKAAFAILLRDIRQDQATLSDGVTQLNNSDSQLAWGLNISASYYLANNDDMSMGLIHGDGVGRYAALNSYSDGTVDNQGNIQLQSTSGGYIAYRHWWNNKLRSSIAYSRVETNNNMQVVPTNSNKEAYSYHINLLWTPLNSAQFGVEYAYLERKQEDGVTADMNRLYFELRNDF